MKKRLSSARRKHVNNRKKERKKERKKTNTKTSICKDAYASTKNA